MRIHTEHHGIWLLRYFNRSFLKMLHAFSLTRTIKLKQLLNILISHHNTWRTLLVCSWIKHWLLCERVCYSIEMIITKHFNHISYRSDERYRYIFRPLSVGSAKWYSRNHDKAFIFVAVTAQIPGYTGIPSAAVVWEKTSYEMKYISEYPF